VEIENKGISITEIPIINRIDVDKNEAMIIINQIGSPVYLTKEKLQELYDAIGTALQHMEGVTVPASSVSAESRVWNKGDPEPDFTVTVVVDVYGDQWVRDVYQQRWKWESSTRKWADLVRRHGPVKEVQG
jgi:hypothetical protein